MEVRDVNTHGGAHTAGGRPAIIKRDEQSRAIPSSSTVTNEPATRVKPERQSNATQTEADMYVPSVYHDVNNTVELQRPASAPPLSYAECPCAACAQQLSSYPAAAPMRRPPTSPYGTITTQQYNTYAAPQTPLQSHQSRNLFVHPQQRTAAAATATATATAPPVPTLSRPAPSTSGDYGHYQQEPHYPPQQKEQPQQHQYPRHNVIQHQPYQLYAQPRPSQQPPPSQAPIYSKAVTAPTALDVHPLIDTTSEFLRKCAGRVVELACTPDGRSMLINALSSQDAALVDTMVREIADDLERVALDVHGCHVLRALQSYASAEHTRILVSCFTETLVLNLCTATQHTRHILESLFQRRLIDLQPIIDVLASHSRYLAATQQGCISFMHILEFCNEAQKKQLISPLVPYFAHVALDPFGNYVVQRIIQSIGLDASEYITSCFAGELLNMSCNKFGSNVVEETIKVCGGVPAVRRLLMEELISKPGALQRLVQDSFGNFVVQTFIGSITDQSELKYVNERLRSVLQNSPYAARIETRLRTALTAASKRNSQASAHCQQRQPHPNRCSQHYPTHPGTPTQLAPDAPPCFAPPSSSFAHVATTAASHHQPRQQPQQQQQQQQQFMSPRYQPPPCNKAAFPQRQQNRRQSHSQPRRQQQQQQPQHHQHQQQQQVDCDGGEC